MRRASWMRLLMVVAAVGLMSGCVVVHDDHPGELTLFWDCPGYYSCGDAGVSQIEVEIWESDRLLTQQSFSWDASGANFAELTPGHYDFRVLGYTPSGLEIYRVEGGAEVDSGAETQVSVHLVN